MKGVPGSIECMNIPLVDLQKQYQSIRSEIDGAIANVIAETAFIKGKYVELFEQQFAKYIGVKHCIGCANGTDAIEIVLRALGVGAGDEVIVPARTWISTSEAVTTVGARVVFVDVDPQFYTIDARKIEEKITTRTKAIIPVHFYGLPAEMDEIMAIAKKHNLFVIEDTAQAHGSKYKGKMTGTFGVAATYSFFPGKNLGAYGDAGGIVTNDDSLATNCRMIADHGRLGKHDHGLEGRNSRLDGLQAAILSAKLPFLNSWTKARQQNAALYDEALKTLDIRMPVVPEYSEHVFHLYVIQVENRDRVQESLQEKGVATGVHYPIALPFLKAYQYLGHKPPDFPIAHTQMTRIMSIPMYPELTGDQINYVADMIATILDFSKARS